nr:hypothetical protein [Tanacetum cinerariifolium]
MLSLFGTASAPKEKATRSAGKSTQGSKSRQASFYGFAVNRESARDVYSKRKIIAVTELKIVEWHNYKHLDWIMVQRDDDKLYKFKEGDFKRLRIQDIEDMLLLLVQGKLTNLTNKDKKNKLMRIDELQKFSDGTLTDVRTALDDRLKGIRIKYLPQSIWRKSDKDRATAMIEAIDKRLKTRRIMRSLERFIGERLEQILLTMKGEAKSNLNDDENDFMLDNAYGDETLEELTTDMIRWQDFNQRKIKTRKSQRMMHKLLVRHSMRRISSLVALGATRLGVLSLLLFGCLTIASKTPFEIKGMIQEREPYNWY